MKKSLLFNCLLINFLFALSLKIDAQTPKSRFAIKFYSGLSISKTHEKKDELIGNKNIITNSPEISYNIYTKKGDIIEIGLRLYTIGNRLYYHDNPITDGNILNKLNTLTIPIVFHKKVGHQKSNFFINFGTMLSYSSLKFTFTTEDDFANTVFSNHTGMKINLNTGIRYIFKTKKQKFGLELNYSQGLTDQYYARTKNNISNLENEYRSKGTSINLGLVLFLSKFKLKE